MKFSPSNWLDEANAVHQLSPFQTKCFQWNAYSVSQTGIFHAIFTFILEGLHSSFLFKFLSYHQAHTRCYQFRLLILFQTHKKMKNTVYWSLNTTKEHYKYNGQPVSTCAATKTTGYLIVRQDDRTRDPLQDWRISMITHQRAHQGIPFQCVHRNTKLQLVEWGTIWQGVRATLLFGSQHAMSVCLCYPIPVGHCQ